MLRVHRVKYIIRLIIDGNLHRNVRINSLIMRLRSIIYKLYILNEILPTHYLPSFVCISIRMNNMVAGGAVQQMH